MNLNFNNAGKFEGFTTRSTRNSADNEMLTNLFGCIGAIFFLIFTIAGTAILNGLALVQLWAWFVVTTFNMPTLQLAPAIGLPALVTFMTRHDSSLTAEQSAEIKRNPAKSIAHSIWKIVSRPLMAVIFGWIVFQFMQQ